MGLKTTDCCLLLANYSDFRLHEVRHRGSETDGAVRKTKKLIAEVLSADRYNIAQRNDEF